MTTVEPSVAVVGPADNPRWTNDRQPLIEASDLSVRSGAVAANDGVNLDLVLRTKRITHLVITGITTDVCVHTTVREANDRGYECLLLEDCTGATEEGNHRAAIQMVKMQGGVFGAVSSSRDLIQALGPLAVRASAPIPR